MRSWLICGMAVVAMVSAAPAGAAPDEAFTQAHFVYVEMKRQEFLAPIVAKGLTPTPAQSTEATCRAIMWWKMANPGGEAKLTFAALSALRRAEIFCGQKMRRAPPLPIERGNPPATVVPPTAGPVDNDGEKEAGEDFIRWHQVTLTDAKNIMDYVYAQVTNWGLFGPGKDLYDAYKKALDARNAEAANALRGGPRPAIPPPPNNDVEIARQRLEAAETAEATRAAEEYARAHPITVENATTIMEYVHAQVFFWGMSEEGKKLYDDLAKAEREAQDALHNGGNYLSADQAVKVARARIDAAEAEAAAKAADEYAAAHPITVANAASTADYVHAQVFLWGRSEEGKKLYDDLANAQAEYQDAVLNGGNYLSAEQAVKVAQARIDAAEAAATEKAQMEWRAAHPGQPETWPQGPRQENRADYDPRVFSGRGGAGSFPVPLEQLPPSTQLEIREWENRTANGSVDPVDAQAWARARGQAREPIIVGANNAVGSSARAADKALSTVLGIAGGLLGVGGGGGKSAGPQLARCNIADRDMTVFNDLQTGTQLKVAARRQGNNIMVFADIARSPDSGTFQTAFLDDQNGQWHAPADVGVCKLYGEWSLSVSWTRTTYVNNRLVGREAGGWSKAGNYELLGVLDASGKPTGMWKQLGFSNASHGAQRVQLTYPASAQQFAIGGMDMVIHVTRPEQNPVTTAPFAMHVVEGAKGFSFQRIQ